VKEFFGMGLTTLAIDPVYEVEWKDEDIEEYVNQLEKVAQYIIHTHHMVSLKPFQDLLPLISGQPFEWRYRCGLAQGSLAMGADGKLHLCFTPDTFVITDNRVKDIIDIKEGEMVLTHSGSYRKVKNLMKRYYEGFIYVVKPYLLPEIKCTPEHPFYIKIGKEYKWIEASELSKYVSGRIRKGAKEDEIAYFVSKIDKVVEDVEYIKLNEMFDNLYYNPKEDKVIEVGSTKPVRNTIPVDDKFLEFIGWFVAEGSLSARDGQISFAFNLEKEMPVAEKIKGYLEWLGCKVSLYVDENHHSIHLGTYNRVVYEFLKTLVGMGAENKRLNMLLKRLPPEKQVKLVHSIFKGDGIWYRKEAVLSTVSRQLAIDVYEILLRLGIIPKFKIYRRKRGWKNELYTEYRIFIYGCEKDMINQNTRDRGRAFIDLEKGEVYYPIYSIEKKDYKGFVYNLEVEEDESYTANLVVVHNCHRFVSSQSGVIGDVFNGIDQNVRLKYNEEYWKVKPYSKTLDCSTCPLQEMCNGGCLAVNYDMNKDVHVIPETFCKIYQAYVKRLLPYVLIMKARGQLMIRKDRIVNVPPE
jgi:radical SAM protein with 4Fe4S-binding SPASM domain